jgi:hypothetical protein
MGSRKRRSAAAGEVEVSSSEEEVEVKGAAVADADRCIASRAALRHAASARSSARSSGRATDMGSLSRCLMGKDGKREGSRRRGLVPVFQTGIWFSSVGGKMDAFFFFLSLDFFL